ncbi:MAG: glycosyltransferase [Pseudomonadota bacterium]
MNSHHADQSEQQDAAENVAPASPASASGLTWGLCVATLNRIDVLERCVALALDQSRAPSEVVIVDASDDWRQHEERIAKITDSFGTPLTYLPARLKSSANQRNQGIAASSSDILFMIDDDSLMFPGAAKEIMSLYEADQDKQCAAIGLSSRDALPGTATTEDNTAATPPTNIGGRAVVWQRRNKLVKFIYKELFLLTMDRLFYEYAPTPATSPEGGAPAWMQGRGNFTNFIGGFAMTVRRDIAQREPFNRHLMSYCPAEDLDTVYRWRRHGFAMFARNAGVHHLVVQTSRIQPKHVTILQITNMVFMTCFNTNRPVLDRIGVSVRVLRRVLADFLKDAGTLRLMFPKFRAALMSLPQVVRLLSYGQDELPRKYERFQCELLWGVSAPILNPDAMAGELHEN